MAIPGAKNVVIMARNPRAVQHHIGYAASLQFDAFRHILWYALKNGICAAIVHTKVRVHQATSLRSCVLVDYCADGTLIPTDAAENLLLVARS